MRTVSYGNQNWIMRIKVVLSVQVLILIFSIKAFSCTIFYLSNDNIILAGNNEDWKDPKTKMWFYPPEDNQYGWIKFGFGSGFPQGGMNDHGLFWDGTSGPYLGMPYSESNKEKYPGPIMERVIAECANVGEAIDIFSNYYCEDQYKAQYLVGDSNHNSIIVEGDSILSMEDNCLILTNFYHSNPELGGYPCWRYNAANEIITNENSYTNYLIGSILSATHQEGNYPTQYSQIYDLRNCQIYLFYYHNYEEFIFIDLKEELDKGYRSFDIPALFSKVKLLTPISAEKITSTTADFSWEGKSGSSYELIYSTSEEFNESDSKLISYNCLPEKSNSETIYHIAGLLIIIPLMKRKGLRNQFVIILLLVLISFECSKDDISPAEEEVITMYETAENLLPNTTYYWKIKSHAIDQNDFQSVTLTKSFMTGNLR